MYLNHASISLKILKINIYRLKEITYILSEYTAYNSSNNNNTLSNILT